MCQSCFTNLVTGVMLPETAPACLSGCWVAQASRRQLRLLNLDIIGLSCLKWDRVNMSKCTLSASSMDPNGRQTPIAVLKLPLASANTASCAHLAALDPQASAVALAKGTNVACFTCPFTSRFWFLAQCADKGSGFFLPLSILLLPHMTLLLHGIRTSPMARGE